MNLAIFGPVVDPVRHIRRQKHFFRAACLRGSLNQLVGECPSRLEANTSLVPSGDHSGRISRPGCIGQPRRLAARHVDRPDVGRRGNTVTDCRGQSFAVRAESNLRILAGFSDSARVGHLSDRATSGGTTVLGGRQKPGCRPRRRPTLRVRLRPVRRQGTLGYGSERNLLSVGGEGKLRLSAETPHLRRAVIREG